MEVNGKEYKLVDIKNEVIEVNDDSGIEDVVIDPCSECDLLEVCERTSDEMNNIEFMLCEGDEFYDEEKTQVYKENKEIIIG